MARRDGGEHRARRTEDGAEEHEERDETDQDLDAEQALGLGGVVVVLAPYLLLQAIVVLDRRFDLFERAGAGRLDEHGRVVVTLTRLADVVDIPPGLRFEGGALGVKRADDRPRLGSEPEGVSD